MVTRYHQPYRQERTGAKCPCQACPQVSLLPPSARKFASLLRWPGSWHPTIWYASHYGRLESAFAGSIGFSPCAQGEWPWPRCGLGQPALAAPVVLQVAIGFAGADFVEPEIELLDVGVLPQRFGGTLENDAAVLHDIAAVGDIERHGGVLLDQEHGQAAL